MKIIISNMIDKTYYQFRIPDYTTISNSKLMDFFFQHNKNTLVLILLILTFII